MHPRWETFVKRNKPRDIIINRLTRFKKGKGAKLLGLGLANCGPFRAALGLARDSIILIYQKVVGSVLLHLLLRP